MIPALYVEAPATAPAHGGLLAVANVINSSDPHFVNGVEYMADGFAIPKFAPNLSSSAIDITDPKESEALGPVISGSAFAIYKATHGDLFASDEHEAQAARVLELGEGAAVERGVELTLLQRDTAVVTPAGITAIDLVAAVAALEKYAAANYGGVPTFHVPRDVATYAVAQRLMSAESDWTLRTGQGSLVANGNYSGESPAGVAAPAGQAWIYATGQVNIWRGDPVATQGFDAMVNKSVALIERVYVGTADGFVAAALVNLIGA